MLSYTHFSLEERKCLQKLLEEGESIRFIARSLGRSPSSVSREIRRNSSKKGYHHWRAQTLSIVRRRQQDRHALCPGTPEWDYIIQGLENFWSPEAISGRWSRDYPERKPLCFSTIYRYVKQNRFPKITPQTHLRRRGKHSLPRNANYNSIQPEHLIPEWPIEIQNRLRLGDWEGDTVYGGTGKGFLVTSVDRKSRYLCAGLLLKRSAEETRQVLENMLRGLPVQSISLDNGSEFAAFRKLETALHTTVYFAEPHKPWQRGTNENTNDILRFFFPKGYDFRNLSQETLQKVVDLINNRPRKCLNWATPAEVFAVALP